MALVKCKGCGHEVSDKASTCPHCGMAVEAEPPKTVCPECGCEAAAGLQKCPRCGDPLEGGAARKAEKPSGKLAGRKKLIIALAVVAAVAVLCAALALSGADQGDIMKLGMSYDEVITFLEEHGYEFEEVEPKGNFGSKWVDIQGEWDINGVKVVHPSTSFSKEDGTLKCVGFMIDIYSLQDMKEKSGRLKKFVSKHYGKMDLSPIGGETADLYEFYSDDMWIYMTCPKEDYCEGGQ